jgi:hypothetical protein
MKFRLSKKESVILLIYLMICITVAAIISTSVNFYFGKTKRHSKNQFIRSIDEKLPAIEVGKEPKLIKAYGSDGTIGYVLSTDLDGYKPKNPKETLELQAKKKNSREIPLYDSIAKKVIGKFIIEP